MSSSKAAGVAGTPGPGPPPPRLYHAVPLLDAGVDDAWRELVVPAAGTAHVAAGRIGDASTGPFAGGYAYADGARGATNTRNRYILWRVHERVLELVELSLDLPLLNNAVRYRFPHAIVPRVSVYEDTLRTPPAVYIVVCTARSLHRLVFPHPDAIRSQQQAQSDAHRSRAVALPSIFSTAGPVALLDLSGHAGIPIHATGITQCCLIAASAVAVGCRNGSLHLIALPDPDAPFSAPIELRRTSVIQRLLTGLLPSFVSGRDGTSAADDAVTSLVAHGLRGGLSRGGDVLILTTCADHRLRIWSAAARQCVLEADLFAWLASDADDGTMATTDAADNWTYERAAADRAAATAGAVEHRIWLVPDSDRMSEAQHAPPSAAAFAAESERFFVLVYLAMAELSRFILVQVDASSSQRGVVSTRACSTLLAPHDRLLDACVSARTVWALWATAAPDAHDAAASFAVTSASLWTAEAGLSDGQGGAFEQDALMQPWHETVQHASVVDIQAASLLERVFTSPPRFSRRALVRAARLLRLSPSEPASVSAETPSYAQLRDDIAAAAATTATPATTGEVGGLDEFESCCMQYHAAASVPWGVFADANTGVSVVVQSEHLSLLRPSTAAESLCFLWQSARDVVDLDMAQAIAAVRSVLPTIDAADAALAVRLGHALYHLAHSLPSDVLRTVPSELAASRRPIEVVGRLAEHAAGPACGPVHDILTHSDASSITRAVRALIELLEAEGRRAADTLPDEQRRVSSVDVRTMYAGPVGVRALCLGALQAVNSCFELARNMCLLPALVQLRDSGVAWPADLAHYLAAEVAPAAAAMVAFFAAAQWVLQQPVAEASADAGPVHDDAMEQHSTAAEDVDDDGTLRRSPPTSALAPSLLDAAAMMFSCVEAWLLLFDHRHALSTTLAAVLGAAEAWTGVEVGPQLLSGAVRRIVSDLTADALPFAAALLPMAQWPLARRFLERYLVGLQEQPQRSPVLVHVAHFLLADCMLGLGDAAAAQKHYIQAAAALHDGAAGDNESALFWRQLHLLAGMGLIELACAPMLDTDGDGANTAEQRTELTYYKLLVRRFEQAHAPTFVVRFALAALQLAVAERVPGHRMAPLWSVIFKYSLDSGAYEQAYSAAVSNPEPDRAADALRRLVLVLCERGELETLCRLPYGRRITEVERALAWRARNLDTGEAAQVYYEVLYALNVLQSNFAHAAFFMFELGERLALDVRVHGLRALQQQAKAYLAALSALSLCRDCDAFFVVRDDGRGSGAADEESAFVIVSRRDAEKRYQLVLAQLEAAHGMPDADARLDSIALLDAPATVALLGEQCRFDRAFRLARLHDLDAAPIFETLAARCAQSAAPDAATADLDWLTRNDAGGETMRGASARAWNYLQQKLALYDSRHTDYAYGAAAAARLIAANPNAALPRWLAVSLLERNCAALLRLYLRRGRLVDAAAVVMKAVASNQRQLGERLNVAGTLWLPYTLIDQLRMALRAWSDTDRSLAEPRDRLDAALAAYTEALRSR